jgi:glycosyltransferase involved in cell wall biosynthesis
MAGAHAFSEPARLTVGIDFRPLRPISSGGIVNSQIGLLREVVVRHPEHRYIVYGAPENRVLMERLGPGAEAVVLPADHYHGLLGPHLGELGADLLYRVYPGTEALQFPPARQIFNIPDNQHDYLPELFDVATLAYRRQAFGMALGQAGAIGTLSEFSRSTLARLAPPGRDIFVIPPALQREHLAGPAPLSPEEAMLLPEQRFFYYPANLWPHKNHARVFTAFRAFLETQAEPFCFVLTGDDTGWPELASEFPDLDIRHLGFVAVDLVQALLRRAEALVFFSLFEGFGMPLLEAFQAGTPVLCSNSTSLPEVAGGAALLAEPTDIAAMAGAMRRIVEDRAVRDELVAGGRRRLEDFSWSHSADSLAAAMGRVAERARRRIAAGFALAPGWTACYIPAGTKEGGLQHGYPGGVAARDRRAR